MRVEQSFDLTTLGEAEAGSFCIMSFQGEAHLGIKTVIAGPVIQTRFAMLTHPKGKAQPRLARLETNERAIVLSDAWLELSLNPESIVFGLKHTAGYICRSRDDAFLLVQVESDEICFVDMKTGSYQIYPPEGQRICFTQWKIVRKRAEREPEVIYSFG